MQLSPILGFEEDVHVSCVIITQKNLYLASLLFLFLQELDVEDHIVLKAALNLNDPGT